MSALAKNIRNTFSYKDYQDWTEGRWELINGIVYDMSPAPLRIHQKISFEIARQIGNCLMDKPCEAYTAPFDVCLPEYEDAWDEDIDTVVQPDLAVICDASKLTDRGCTGAPDMIIEILSPATAGKDLQKKRLLYEKHGVKEYWIVHPTDKIVMVYTCKATGRYGQAEIHTENDIVRSSVISGLFVDLTLIF